VHLTGIVAAQGALPIKIGDEVIGAAGISGAPGGEKDEACVKAVARQGRRSAQVSGRVAATGPSGPGGCGAAAGHPLCDPVTLSAAADAAGRQDLPDQRLFDHRWSQPAEYGLHRRAAETVRGIDRVRAAVRNSGSVRLAIPLNHGVLPRNAAQLKELGVGYTNCAPTPEARLLKSLSDQAAEQRKLLG
jgi:Haem-degrading